MHMYSVFMGIVCTTYMSIVCMPHIGCCTALETMCSQGSCPLQRGGIARVRRVVKAHEVCDSHRYCDSAKGPYTPMSMPVDGTAVP